MNAATHVAVEEKRNAAEHFLLDDSFSLPEMCPNSRC